MSLDSEFERFKAAQAAADDLDASDPNPRNSEPRRARFELHVRGPRNETLEYELLDLVGRFSVESRREADASRGQHGAGVFADKHVYVWDVEDPSVWAATARNLNVRAAELTKQDAYLVWYALTGFPMLYETEEA